MRSSPMFRSLRHRNAQLFFGGLMVSNIGTWMQMTAMSLLVYELTGKATDTGITLLCQFLPMLLLGSWAGAVADRHNKREMALLTQSLQAVQALVLGGFTLAGVVNLPLLYGLSFVLGVVNAFDNPARRSFVIELVEPDDIGNALSLNTAVMTGSRVVGPALAAVLKEPIGAGWLFMLNGLSFTAIVGSLLLIDRSALRPSPRAARGGTPVRDAIRFIGSDRRLRTIFIVFTMVGTFAFNYSVSLLKLSDIRFDSTVGFGLLLASTGVGSVIGSLLTGSRARVSSAWFLGNGALLGLSGLALAWSPGMVVALLVSVPVGMGGAAFISAQNVIVQQEAPDDMRGRLLALGAVAFLGSTPIGAPITGLVADHVSAEWSLAYGSIITLAAVAVGYVVLRPSAAPVPQPVAQSATAAPADAH